MPDSVGGDLGQVDVTVTYTLHVVYVLTERTEKELCIFSDENLL